MNKKEETDIFILTKEINKRRHFTVLNKAHGHLNIDFLNLQCVLVRTRESCML